MILRKQAVCIFYGVDVLAVTQPTLSKQRMKYNALMQSVA